MGEWQQHRPSSLINRSLLAPKFFNLFYSASLASLIPFLPVYYRFLGLTAFQSGLLGAGKGFISFWSTPIWCLTAERVEKRKCLLLLMVIAGTVLHVCLGLVKKDDNKFGTYLCKTKHSDSFAGSLNQETYLNGRNRSSNTSGIFFTKARASGAGQNSRPGSSKEAVRHHVNTELDKNQIKTSGDYKHKSQIRNSSHNEFHPSSRSRSRRGILDPRLKNDSRKHLNHSTSLRGHETSQQTIIHVTTTAVTRSTQMRRHIKGDFWYKFIGFRMDHTFKLLLILILVTEFLSSPIKSLGDSLASDIIQWSRGSSMTANRAWGSFGFMVGAGAITVVIGQYGCLLGLKNGFYLHFYIFAFFGAASFIFGALFQTYDLKAPGQLHFSSTCKFLCCDIHILSFLLILWVIGVAESLHSNFIMWYLQDIKTSTIVMGLILITVGFSELVMHVLAPYLIRWLGQEWIMFLSLLAYGGRFLYFSYIKDAWLIIPIQLLHGLSQTAMWHACTSYAAVSAPHGMERTMQTLFVMVYKFFGTGLGGVGVAMLYQLYGPIVVFRCAAGVCGMYCILFGMLHCILGMQGGVQEKRKTKLMEYRQFQHGREWNGNSGHQADWLLEALDADEEDNIFSR